MSLDMFGEGYLSCMESKSGHIERLLLRFLVENDCGKFLCSCLLVWLVTNRARDSGGASFGASTFIDHDP